MEYHMNVKLVTGTKLTRSQLANVRMLVAQAANHNINAHEIADGVNGDFYFEGPVPKDGRVHVMQSDGTTVCGITTTLHPARWTRYYANATCPKCLGKK